MTCGVMEENMSLLLASVESLVVSNYRHHQHQHLKTLNFTARLYSHIQYDFHNNSD